MFCRINMVGYMGRDAKLKTTRGGESICTFSVAVSRRWTDQKSGERQESTTWFEITVKGEQALACAALKKGNQVLIQGGQIKAVPYEINRQPRTAIHVMADRVLLIEGDMAYGWIPDAESVWGIE